MAEEGHRRRDFEAAYQAGTPPWDIGRPQSEIVKLAEEGEVNGGTLHILCFSDEEPPGPGPRRIAEYDLRAAFRSLFALVRIRPAVFESLARPGGAKAWLATLVRI